MAVSRNEAQTLRYAATQCPRPWSRKKLRSAMWLNRPNLTARALYTSTGRKPGPGRTRGRITAALEKAIEDAKQGTDKKMLSKLRGLLKVLVPTKKTVKKAARGR